MVKEFETQVIDLISRTPNVLSVRLKDDPEVCFKAGQYLFVTLKRGNQELSKVLSISSSPTERGYFEFTKKLSESEFSKALKELKVGDWAKLKMPFGKFTFEGEYKKIAFLSGGIGITPIRSICKFVTDNRIDSEITLLYSNQHPEDIAFKNDFDAMQMQNKKLKVAHIITCPDTVPQWKGLTGYINEALISAQIPDFQERIFYLCGPPKMVEALILLLKEKMCVSGQNIITENFSGY